MKSIKELKYKGISKVGFGYHIWNTKWWGTKLINSKAFPAKQLLGYFSNQPASLVLFSLRAGFRKCIKLTSTLIVLFIQVTDGRIWLAPLLLLGGPIPAGSPHWMQREILPSVSLLSLFPLKGWGPSILVLLLEKHTTAITAKLHTLWIQLNTYYAPSK